MSPVFKVEALLQDVKINTSHRTAFGAAERFPRMALLEQRKCNPWSMTAMHPKSIDFQGSAFKK